ncbi:hypothetical protein [Cohnella luojiensis]|uniref:Uncharacterized protein n=1 Tax=Cohnella luojiensis TaxID=652876 RepID=A0A4Y8M5A0_9BACL|nr:hypothetical protein [Cohnella luojiensis]TFE30846.1 hypothetical protein E2980_03455 [Cohnella luojiensis]
MKQYVWNLLISIDQLANTLLGGSPDETISSRMGKRAIKGDRLGRLICRFLDLFDKGHCKKSIEEDEGRPL